MMRGPMETTRDPNDEVSTPGGTTTVGELWDRCFVNEPGIVVLREPPHNCAETYEVQLTRAIELGAKFPLFTLVNDLTDVTERPRGRYLELIRFESIGRLGQPGRPIHLATTQPGSALLRRVLAFILGRMSARTSVHATREEALARCRKEMLAAEDARRA